ncbi:23S rRNA (uracil(747)-C(5))-methyltransferase RlmC [Pasteurellaceae bacterium HPA106]|uniref:23S rRNA (uracil(747)-C(5))-methyltransferase RlmC n=1 Tax=Spirabiliibacterium pneumoniae TaxID=221400 RepID=UPI001AADD303|nr:23S rRNA (uracil(747)-C(5))-methyltransferase RlmC [Spirabiliibacterium pneumoniae]MBE2895378.1 23S rRNA (uracil(747)-C(5))-methyltransferase RlmC [Spirabiliibacterium pneumoniae]
MAKLACDYHRQGLCHSCQWLEVDYHTQLTRKSAHLLSQLAPLQVANEAFLPPYASPFAAFRNRAKMAVSGSVERPILGIIPDPQMPQSAVDLCYCPLYPTAMQQLMVALKDFIARAGLVPYNPAKRKGELKYILLSFSQHSGRYMLRWVLHSDKKLALITRELPALLARLPQLAVVSVNIQPQHAAILEGEQEIILTPQTALCEIFNDVPLFLRPNSFFQTNPTVASALYHQAQAWVSELPVSHIWDLFCGVGGFGLHCLQALRAAHPHALLSLTGIEISPPAIESATQSAREMGLVNKQTKVRFASLDAVSVVNHTEKPDLVIVNPPRRGIGQELAAFLNQLQPHFILYSSCNARSMAQDLAQLTHYHCQKVRLFDMFPHTAHYEVLVLLRLKAPDALCD